MFVGSDRWAKSTQSVAAHSSDGPLISCFRPDVDRVSSKPAVLHHEHIYSCKYFFTLASHHFVTLLQWCAVGVLSSGLSTGVWAGVPSRLAIVVNTGWESTTELTAATSTQQSRRGPGQRGSSTAAQHPYRPFISRGGLASSSASASMVSSVARMSRAPAAAARVIMS